MQMAGSEVQPHEGAEVGERGEQHRLAGPYPGAVNLVAIEWMSPAACDLRRLACLRTACELLIFWPMAMCLFAATPSAVGFVGVMLQPESACRLPL